MSEKTGLEPPWALFCDDGKPVTIMPAGRPGAVCSVEGYTMEEAQAIVNAANRAHDELWDRRVTRLCEMLGLDIHDP